MAAFQNGTSVEALLATPLCGASEMPDNCSGVLMTLYLNQYRTKSSRFRRWDYRSRGWYFVTICTQNRALIFGNVLEGVVKLSQLGCVADRELRDLPVHYSNVQIDAYVVMPNHAHLLVMVDGDHRFTPVRASRDPGNPPASGIISPRSGSLSAIVQSYKAGVTKRSRDLGLFQQVWQSSFYDHVAAGTRTSQPFGITYGIILQIG
jgi:putative transposase